LTNGASLNFNDIFSLSDINGLMSLDFYDNDINDILFSSATEPFRFYLGNNDISDISALSEISNISILHLDYLPLDTLAYCKYLPQIENNNPGIELEYDPNPNPISNDCVTTETELCPFFSKWLETGCDISNNWCQGIDFDHNNNVDLTDYAIFAMFWAGNLE